MEGEGQVPAGAAPQCHPTVYTRPRGIPCAYMHAFGYNTVCVLNYVSTCGLEHGYAIVHETCVLKLCMRLLACSASMAAARETPRKYSMTSTWCVHIHTYSMHAATSDGMHACICVCVCYTRHVCICVCVCYTSIHVVHVVRRARGGSTAGRRARWGCAPGAGFRVQGAGCRCEVKVGRGWGRGGQ